jgi:hypothetical protein
MACESTQDYTINMCSGECVSTTTSVDGKMQRQCSCCSASKTVEREIEVKCEDDTIRKYTIELVEECTCGVTKCEAENPKKEARKQERKKKRQERKNKKGLGGKIAGFFGF